MRYFRQENLDFLVNAIVEDEYDDISQVINNTGGQIGGIPKQATDFIDMFIDSHEGIESSDVLEIGVGTGAYYSNNYVTHVLDPSNAMIEGFKRRHAEKPDIHYKKLSTDDDSITHGVAECLPDSWKDKFSAVLFTNGIFQVRSDYEVFLEVNRALKKGGVFIFNIYEDDNNDIICGRILGSNNYIRILREFGFSLVAKKSNCGTSGITYICVRKESNARSSMLRKLQLVPVDTSEKLYKVNNLDFIRDYSIL